MNQTSHSDGGRLKPPAIVEGKVPTEHEEQRYFVYLFRRTFPGVRIFAIPNGGHRGIREATRLKNEGVSAGVPDLFIPEWLTWVEMKRQKGGRVDPDQKEWHAYLQQIGQRVIVARGWEDAMRQLQK